MDFGAYLFTEPTFLAGPYESEFTNPSLRASGPLFRLPGGSATLTLAVQQEALRIERASNTVTDVASRNPIYVVFPGREQKTTSQYAELVLPLAGPANGVPFLRELELRAAVRHDDFLTKSPPAAAGSFVVADPDAALPAYDELEAGFESTNYTLAVRYSPVDGVVLRGSYATGFLPPDVVQLGSQSSPAPFGLGVPDPFRGGEIINYALTSTGGSGNLMLRPEDSESLSAGVVLTPLSGLRISADYTHIKKTDEIGGIPLQYLLANPDVFPGRVVRAAPAPGDPAGYAGRLISIDTSPINLLNSEFKSFDFQVDYERQTQGYGEFRVYALATWQPDTVRRLVAGAPALNYSGNADGPLEWQGNGGIDWTLGAWQVLWNTQYYAGYNVFTTQNVATPSGAALVQNAITLQGGRRIPSQTYSDLYVSYAIGERGGVLDGVRVSAGVQNIFNQTPPVVAITSYTQAGYSTYGDPRLRRFTLSLTKAF